MNPLRLRLRNLRTFVELDLDLPEGKVAILGGNGAGKSTVATAIDWALFGPDARSWAPYLTQGGEQTELLIELTFEHGGAVYRVRRGYSSRGSGKATLDLHFRPEPDWGWTPRTCETVKETQQLVEQILGLNRQTFRASSMLVQGDGAAFTEAQPRDRKQILAQILGLDRWERYLDRAKTDLRGWERRLDELSGELAGVDELLDTRPEVELAIGINRQTLTEAEQLGAEHVAAAKAAEERLRELTQNDAARARATAEALSALNRLEPLRAKAVAAEAAADERQIAVEELEIKATPAQAEAVGRSLADLRARREQVAARNFQRETAKADRERLLVQIGALVARADALLVEGARLRDPDLPAGELCSHCGQPLTSPAARAHAAGQLDTEAKQLLTDSFELKATREGIEIPDQVELGGLIDEIEAAELAYRIAQGAAAERARLEERIAGLDRAIAQSPSADELQTAVRLHTAAADALAALPAAADQAELDRLGAARRTAEDQAAAERTRWQNANADLARLDEQLRRIVEVAARVEQAQTERVLANAEIDELHVLVRAYGRDGIPAWIVSQVAIPQIEAEACRILAELGTSYQVELRTLRATGAGDLVDALDVIVQTPDGERPYETFSGGERTRINLALRIALARLLANRSRGESRLLVIDEPEFLDQQGTQALVGVIRGLTDFDRVWLISHVPDLADAPLDGTVRVTRGEDGWSRVEVS